MYLHVDLCAGLGGWTAPTRAADNWRVVGVDIEPLDGADLVGDVRQLPLTASQDVTLVTASPPCQEFSLARNPKIPPGEADYSIWEGCREAIDELSPDYWVIENVRGAIRHMGQPAASHKPYYLWGFFPPLDPGPMPEKGEAVGHRPHDAAKIPYPLADAVRQAVETWS